MERTRTIFAVAFLILLAVGPVAGAPIEKGTAMTAAKALPSWEGRFRELLPALGHRNWIVVADSAFPLQISPGMEIIVSGEELLPVLDKVLAAIDNSKHVRPHVCLDKELAYVSDDLSAGAEAFRKQLDARLKGRDTKPVLHEELIGRLDQAAKMFKVLMIKTNLAIPYTSVFLELDCGYWPAASEAKMRDKMKADKR